MRVEKLQRKFGLKVHYRHFPLHPDTPPEGMTLEALFAGRNVDVPAAQARMKGLMAEEGLPYGDRPMTYNSRLAQELAVWASEQPGGDVIHDRLFRAYFVDDVNLAEPDKLVEIAADAGLDAALAREVLEQRLRRREVDADWRLCRELGITGVPTFVAGGRALVGAQSYEQLESLVSMV